MGEINLLARKNRILAEVKFLEEGKDTARAICIIDTGCINTLLSEDIAKEFGRKQTNLSNEVLDSVSRIVLGGTILKCNVYMIRNLSIGGNLLSRVLVLGGDIKSVAGSNMILGLNVLNSWEYTINSAKYKLVFRETEEGLFGAEEYIRYSRYIHPSRGNYALIEDMQCDVPNNLITKSAVFGESRPNSCDIVEETLKQLALTKELDVYISYLEKVSHPERFSQIINNDEELCKDIRAFYIALKRL